MDDYRECDVCHEEFPEDELIDGECEECREREFFTLDEIAQENGFSSWASSYNQ